jgi:hypothetical protein
VVVVDFVFLGVEGMRAKEVVDRFVVLSWVWRVSIIVRGREES